MAADEKWYFTKSQLASTPSRKCGLDADKELSYRQQAANFIQDMGQRLKVTQLCINTAIVYMHRFYVFHSFTQFHRNSMAAAALFLAAKVEEQPRKLEHVITVAHWCLFREEPKLDTKSETYLEQAQELVFNENVLLQTLGFDVAIDHPHTHVVRCCHLVRANKELAQTSYFMASNSLHLTTMCLQYKPTVVACFCIHLACKWSNWEIPQSNEGKDWFTYVDPSVSMEQLEQLTGEFLQIFDKCPSRLKKMSGKKDEYGLMSGFPTDSEPRKSKSNFPTARPVAAVQSQGGPSGSQTERPVVPEEAKKPPKVDYKEYKEKKAREAAAAAAAVSGAPSSMAANPGVSNSGNKDLKPSLPAHGQPPRPLPPNHHLAKREAAKREMMARETAKREALKQQEAMRREGSIPRHMDSLNPHHFSLESREQKRPREMESAGSSSSSAQPHLDLSTPVPKRPEGHHAPVDPSRRPREPLEMPAGSAHHHHHHHGHHHGDHARREPGGGARPREHLDSVAPGHHSSHPSMHSQLKRPRESLEPGAQPVGQSKRPREGADPMVNMLDPTKRPREPTDSSHPFNSFPTDRISQSSDLSQHSDRHPHLDQKPLKYPQPNPQATSFTENRKSSMSANTSASQRSFSQSRTHDSSKMFDLERSKLEEKKDPLATLRPPSMDSQSLRPSHSMNRSPTFPTPKTKSPCEPFKNADSRALSPLVDSSKPPASEVSKRSAEILSRPSGHLFSPDDDREDSSLPSLDDFLPTKFESKPSKHSPSVKPKHHTATPDKSKESSLSVPMFALPATQSSPASQGKSGLPTTPTTPNSDRKRRRTQSSSSNSEPELVPVVRKLEDMPGFHSIMKDGNMGIKLPGRVPDMIQPIRDHSLPATPGKEAGGAGESFKMESAREAKHAPGWPSILDPVKVERSQEAPPPVKPPPSIFEPQSPVAENPLEALASVEESAITIGEQHHRKKKKEKHGKKDKDKDRNREEKKHKHKKKERERAEKTSEPIKITITKDKLANASQEKVSQETSGIKIKIPKERLKVESPPAVSMSSGSYVTSGTSSSTPGSVGGLKIKIGKEVMSERRLEASPSMQTSRKRGTDPSAVWPPAPMAATNAPRRNYKQNGHPDRKVPLKVDSLQTPGGRQ